MAISNFLGVSASLAVVTLPGATGMPQQVPNTVPNPVFQRSVTAPLGQQAITDFFQSQLSFKGVFLKAIIGGQQMTFRSLREKFDVLSAAWEDANLGRSVLNYNDFNMRQVIGMGPVAVPFLLEKLKEEQVEWVVPLKAIAGESAESPEMVGDPQQIVNSWLAWGLRNGHRIG